MSAEKPVYRIDGPSTDQKALGGGNSEQGGAVLERIDRCRIMPEHLWSLQNAGQVECLWCGERKKAAE